MKDEGGRRQRRDAGWKMPGSDDDGSHGGGTHEDAGRGTWDGKVIALASWVFWRRFMLVSVTAFVDVVRFHDVVFILLLNRGDTV